MGCVGFQGAKRRDLVAILADKSNRMVIRSLRKCKSKGCRIAGRSRSREIFSPIRRLGAKTAEGNGLNPNPPCLNCLISTLVSRYVCELTREQENSKYNPTTSGHEISTLVMALKNILFRISFTNILRGSTCIGVLRQRCSSPHLPDDGKPPTTIEHRRAEASKVLPMPVQLPRVIRIHAHRALRLEAR